jgi:hypothetical protein
VPELADERVVRIALDINVLVADILSRDRRRASAATRMVEAATSGRCAAGPVQLVTSLPIIENYADVLRRRLGYDPETAQEKAWLLEQYAHEGAVPTNPFVPVGTGYVPFETEADARRAAEAHLRREDGQLFDEIRDDRYVLETALVGRADLLVTCDVRDFRRGPAVRFERDDLLLFPLADRTLVICSPAFAAHWLGQGIIPDAGFVAANPLDFRRLVEERTKPKVKRPRKR